MSLPTLRIAEEALDDVAALRERAERAELAEAEARRLQDELEQVATTARMLLAQTDARNPWACSAINLLAMRAERALEAP